MNQQCNPISRPGKLPGRFAERISGLPLSTIGHVVREKISDMRVFNERSMLP
jgi:hypothetical protein